VTTEAVAERASAPSAVKTLLAGLRRAVGRWGLIVALLALPVIYGVNDLVSGYPGFAHGRATTTHDLTYLANNLVAGLSNGSIWALIAIGYTLVYGIIELINFAHGDVFMIGSMTAAGFWASIGLGLATGPLGLALGLLLTLIVSMLVCGFLNVLIERVGYRPLRNAPKLAPLITAIGFSFILQNVGLLWIGGSPAGVSDLIHQNDTVFRISAVVVRRADVLAIAATIPLVLLLTWFISRTRSGKAMRATAQDPEAARLMGINIDNTISLTFLLGGMLAGAAGLIYALYETTIWYFQGFEAGLIAFTAAVMGGIGNVRGAMLGGVIIGCIQQISDARIGPAWTPAIVFGFLILIMVLRPQGLLGEETREAG
jgi:branched-chain amino acid transport system permease protein